MSLVSSPTTLLNRMWFEPILKPRQIVRIEPSHKYGWFRIPENATPESLPAVTINMATPFTNPLAAMSDTGSQTSIKNKKVDLDMPGLSLAHYRLVARDCGVYFRIYQPAAIARYTNKNGPIYFDYGSTMYHYANQNWASLPELFVFEDQTPPTIEAISEDLNQTTYWARITAFGFRYPLEPIDPKNLKGRPTLVLSVEGRQ